MLAWSGAAGESYMMISGKWKKEHPKIRDLPDAPVF